MGNSDNVHVHHTPVSTVKYFIEQHFQQPRAETMDDIVSVNVGGIIYTTSRSTLCRYPDSMLGASGAGPWTPPAKDKDGNHFIDRNGVTFQHVLEFLRQCKLVLPDDFKDYDLLENEADFYQIPALTRDVIRKHREEKTHEKAQVEYIMMECTDRNVYEEGAHAYQLTPKEKLGGIEVKILGPLPVLENLMGKLRVLTDVYLDRARGFIDLGKVFRFGHTTQAEVISTILSIPGFRIQEPPHKPPYPMIDGRQTHTWFTRE
ncbi:uncharacterized protein [Amphiura filiformis]|uniref:uncharacterized protein n=1 Tax=Amphiura filiformis TaxID=82378 RepID=UPI003B225F8C